MTSGEPNDDLPGIELAPNIRAPQGILRFDFSRSSGPGGQNVNKLSTKARLCVALRDLEPLIGGGATHRLRDIAGPARLTDAGDVVIVSEQSRSQHANRQDCLDRLREMLIRALHPPKARRATKPTKGSRRRRLNDKAHRGDIKQQRRGGHGQD